MIFIPFSFTFTLLNIKNDFNSKIIFDIYIVSATVKVLIIINRSTAVAVAVAVAVLTADVDYLALFCYYFTTYCSMSISN